MKKPFPKPVLLVPVLVLAFLSACGKKEPGESSAISSPPSRSTESGVSQDPALAEALAQIRPIAYLSFEYPDPRGLLPGEPGRTFFGNAADFAPADETGEFAELMDRVLNV